MTRGRHFIVTDFHDPNKLATPHKVMIFKSMYIIWSLPCLKKKKSKVLMSGEFCPNKIMNFKRSYIIFSSPLSNCWNFQVHIPLNVCLCFTFTSFHQLHKNFTSFSLAHHIRGHDDFHKIQSLADKRLYAFGYDTYIVFINSSNEHPWW